MGAQISAKKKVARTKVERAPARASACVRARHKQPRATTNTLLPHTRTAKADVSRRPLPAHRRPNLQRDAGTRALKVGLAHELLDGFENLFHQTAVVCVYVCLLCVRECGCARARAFDMRVVCDVQKVPMSTNTRAVCRSRTNLACSKRPSN